MFVDSLSILVEHLDELSNSKVIIFGAGSAGQKISFLLKLLELKPAYFVDNDKKKWGSSVLSANICDPKTLLTESKKNVKVLIASVYDKEIRVQLAKMGFKIGVNFYSVTVDSIVDPVYILQHQVIALNNEIANQQNQINCVNHEIANQQNQIVGLNNEIADQQNQIICLKNERVLLERKFDITTKKRPINVVILIYYAAYWSIQSLYELMKEDDNFNIDIVVVPFTMFEDKGHEMQELNNTYEFFAQKNMRVHKGIDEINDSILDIKLQFNPDLIIYQTHWMHLIPEEFRIDNFHQEVLCIDVPYGYMIAGIPHLQFNQPFHNLCWKIFCETPMHKELAIKYADNKGTNVISAGYPKMDVFFDNDPIDDQKIWKNEKTGRKRIIWAPHYSINTNTEINFATFHRYYKKMYCYAMAHPEFDWILKPHPILKKHCISENIMKAEEIEKYFDDWNNLPNAKVVEGGEYLDIFKTSDAIILDSISFIAEYMVTGKPILFTCKHKTILDTEFNEFGVELAKNLYKAHRWSDITSFIKTVVSEGKDTLIQHRMDFINETLRHNENAAAETIIKCIKDALI